MLPVFFYTVGDAILYCSSPYTTVGACCPFLIRRRRDPLLCYPPLHYCWGRCCPFYIRLAAQSSTVLPPPTLLLGQTLPVLYALGGAILYCATLPYTTVGADSARLFSCTVDGAILYCATPFLHYCCGGCCPFLFYTVGGAILYCATPPLHYCWGRCCPFFKRLAARSSTVLPSPILLLGRMLTVFHTLGGAILYCATPPYTTVGANAARFVLLYGWRRDSLLPTLLLGQMLPGFCTAGGAILNYCATPP